MTRLIRTEELWRLADRSRAWEPGANLTAHHKLLALALADYSGDGTPHRHSAPLGALVNRAMITAPMVAVLLDDLVIRGTLAEWHKIAHGQHYVVTFSHHPEIECCQDRPSSRVAPSGTVET